MSLQERIQTDTTAAMRSGDALRRDVLRMVQNTAYNLEKSRKAELSDEELLAVLAREVKTRRESVDAFRKGGREDLAAKEESEIAILQNYLPQQLTAEELRAEVAAAIAAVGAKSAKDMGAVMKLLTPKLQGRAEGRAISEEVKNQLSKL